MKLLRLTVVLATCLTALLGTTSLASAAPAPKLTPQQVQSLCIAKKSVELLKAVDKQRWKDLRAKAAALKAIPDQAKAACTKPGTTPPATVTVNGSVTAIANGKSGGNTVVSSPIVCPEGTVAQSIEVVRPPNEGIDNRDGVAVSGVTRTEATGREALVVLTIYGDSGTSYTATATVTCGAPTST